MTLYTWYMRKANECAKHAEAWRYAIRVPVTRLHIKTLQDRCATYVTLANEAAARYGA